MNALDISCYYDEASDEYHIPKEEQDEFIEIFRIIQKQNKQLTEEVGDLRCRETYRKAEMEELKTSLQTTTSYHTDRYELLEDELKKVKDDAEKNDVFCYIKITDLEIENEKLKKVIKETKRAMGYSVSDTEEEEEEEEQ